MPKLYWMSLSPPARSVYFFAKAIGVDLTLVDIDLTKGEQKKPEFLAINPNGQVPCLQDDDGFVIFESAAIIRYLSAKHTNSVLPSTDAKAAAKVDMHAELVKSKVFSHTGTLVYNSVFLKVVTGKDPDPAVIQNAQNNLNESFKNLETVLYRDSPHHVVGTTLSLADVLLGTYLSQLILVSFSLDAYPKTKAFWEHLQTLPAFVESHKPYFAALAAFKK